MSTIPVKIYRSLLEGDGKGLDWLIKEGYITLIDANEIRIAAKDRRQELLPKIRSLANSACKTMERTLMKCLKEE